MDVWTYFAQREREFAELSLVADRSPGEMFWELEGSGGQRGRMFGAVFLTDDAYLQIAELVVVENDHVHREEYAYFLIMGGLEVWGYERDPTHDPPEHYHDPDHVRHPAEAISFKHIAELAWQEVTRQHEQILPPPTVDD